MQVLRLVVLVVCLSLCAACTQLLSSATPVRVARTQRQ